MSTIDILGWPWISSVLWPKPSFPRQPSARAYGAPEGNIPGDGSQHQLANPPSRRTLPEQTEDETTAEPRLTLMFNLQQAATRVGISPGLLHLWVNAGKIKPSLDMSVDPESIQNPLVRNAVKQSSWADRESSSNWIFTQADIERLRKMVEQTAESKSKIENHIKGTDYSPQELALEWGLGVDKIRELFADEPGVTKIKNPPKKGKRQYVTLRIPERVAERVQRRLS